MTDLGARLAKPLIVVQARESASTPWFHPQRVARFALTPFARFYLGGAAERPSTSSKKEQSFAVAAWAPYGARR